MSRPIFFVCFLAILMIACSGSTEGQAKVIEICTQSSDCHCPSGYTPDCVESECLCLKTEIVEGPPKECLNVEDCQCQADEQASCEAGICHCTATQTINLGCTAPTDCDCGTSPFYTSFCNEGVCYCEEESRECYFLIRGETCDILMRKLIDLDAYVPPETPTYSDVPTTNPYYAAIEAATEMGLMEGYTDPEGNPIGIFGPYDQITRAQLTKPVSLAVDALSGFTPPTVPTYVDVEPDKWYFSHVEAVTALGLTYGYINQDGSPTGYYGPIDIASNCFLNEMLAHAEIP